MKQKLEEIFDLEEKCRRYESESTSSVGVHSEPSNEVQLKKRNLVGQRKFFIFLYFFGHFSFGFDHF